MVYMDGDNDLEEFAGMDFNEMETVGSTGNIAVVVQFDPAGHIYNPRTKRYLVLSDTNNGRITSKPLENLGQKNMASPDTLGSFISWAVQECPADHYCLVLWNHGSAWEGALYDEHPNTGPPSTDKMTLDEMAEGLETGLEAAGLGSLDIIICDMCMMGSVEVAYSLAPYGRYLVASPALTLAEGYDYGTLLKRLDEEPDMEPPAFARVVADEFMNACAAAISEDEAFPFAVSVVELRELDNLAGTYGSFADALEASGEDWWIEVYKSARAAQDFVKVDEFSYSAFVDLGDFAFILSNLSSDEAVRGNAALVRAALERTVAYNRKNELLPWSTGLSIFIPPSDWDLGNLSLYEQISFCNATGWNTLALEMAGEVEKYPDGVDIRGLDLSTAILSGNETVICSAVMDAFFPSMVCFLVTDSEPSCSGMVEVTVFQKTANTVTLPGGRVIESWEIENNSLSVTWDGTRPVLSNGTDSIPLCILEYDGAGRLPLHAMADVTLANGALFAESDVFINGNTGEILYCILYDEYYNMIFHALEQGDSLTPYSLLFNTGPGSGGITFGPSGNSITVSGDGLIFDHAPAANGDYFAGFYVLKRNQSACRFEHLDLAIQR
jgi:hypothetical protein